jgi:hypothetical protein
LIAGILKLTQWLRWKKKLINNNHYKNHNNNNNNNNNLSNKTPNPNSLYLYREVPTR